jgi:hypothetical protein
LFRADSRSEVRGRRERERGLGEETGPSSSVKGLRERELKRERETERQREEGPRVSGPVSWSIKETTSTASSLVRDSTKEPAEKVQHCKLDHETR